MAAQVQLVTLGVLNIVTDCMLIVLPIPVLTILQAPLRRKLQLYALFALGVFIVGITAIRLPINSLNKSSQDNRTVWASTELLTSAIAVNAPTLVSLWNSGRRNHGALGHQNRDQQRDHIETIGGSNSTRWKRSKGSRGKRTANESYEDGATMLDNTAEESDTHPWRAEDIELDGPRPSSVSSNMKVIADEQPLKKS